MSFVVAGVSGNTGKVVAESLLAQRQPVRVLVRDAQKGEPWKAKGAEVVVADLGDEAALAKALKGAQGAYLLLASPQTEPDLRAYQGRISKAIAGALAKSPIPHAVFLSSIGAQLSSGTGPILGIHRAEATLSSASGTRFSFIRAAYFIENFGSALATLEQGFIPSFLPANLAIDVIATEDIGKLAAALLIEGTERTQVVELGAPPVSANDIAAALGRIVGNAVRVQEAPLDAVIPTLTGFGFSADVARLYREMLDGLARGHIRFEGGHRRVHGTTPPEAVLRKLLGRA